MSAQVVLLRDGRWPTVPGVCCWRHGAREAFTAAGATVREVTWTPLAALEPAELAPPAPRVEGARAPWVASVVPKPLRRALGRAQRRIRAVRERARPRANPKRPLPPSIAGADFVLAESFEQADDLLARGVPGGRIWVLALPPGWLPGPPSPSLLMIGTVEPQVRFATAVADTAERIAGLLTDSELARSSLERAASRTRLRVELFPPVAADRPCPECADAAVSTVDADPRRLPWGPWQLATWRVLRDQPDAELPYSFVVARRRGLSAPWPAAARLDWPHESATAEPTPIVGAPADDWSAHAQERTAAAMLAAAAPREPAVNRPRRRVLISGYDLKFATELAAQLDRRTDLSVTLDEWVAVGQPSPQTQRRAAEAETIFAEWARPSAVGFSRTKRPGQMLVVRLHRYELESAYPRQIEIDNVDAVVYIAPMLGRRIRDELGWPAEKLVYLPNFVDLDWYDRPKLPSARFGIGLVGADRLLKRLDLALDILAEVRRVDGRFTLHVRTTMPWESPYAWARAEEREYVGWCVERVDNDALLRGGVIFESPGRDMARWYRRVGHILSTSDVEGSHTAVSEGMASGSVPIIRPWPGAAELYDKQWLYQSVPSAVAAILASADAEVWAERSAAARAEIRRSHDNAAVVAAWADLLHGDAAAARGRFEAYTSL